MSDDVNDAAKKSGTIGLVVTPERLAMLLKKNNITQNNMIPMSVAATPVCIIEGMYVYVIK